MNLIADDSRIVFAIIALIAYVCLCLLILKKQLNKKWNKSVAILNKNADSRWLVIYATQTGTSEDLAKQTIDVLQQGGITAQLINLSDLSIEQLSIATHALFIVSTYGEGDAPDEAAVFADSVMHQEFALAHLKYAVMALGDNSYVNFCGFGKELDRWLKERRANTIFDRVDVNACDEEAFKKWWMHLNQLTGSQNIQQETCSVLNDWRLVERRLLNSESVGEPVWHLELEPVDIKLPQWQSGDLVQIFAPNEERPRDYSIASIPEDGRIHLLVRLRRGVDGSLGAVSGWLTMSAKIGEIIQLRLRSHRLFHLGENISRPLILIGNGTGMAGLRGHLKTRLQLGEKLNWLIFGERNAVTDFHYRDDINTWQESGLLERVDMVFSRDQPQRRYVQHRLQEVGESLCTWVEQGAAIYICGSLKGMAAEVHQTLIDLLGQENLKTLAESGRYRRDVY